MRPGMKYMRVISGALLSNRHWISACREKKSSRRYWWELEWITRSLADAARTHFFGRSLPLRRLKSSICTNHAVLWSDQSAGGFTREKNMRHVVRAVSLQWSAVSLCVGNPVSLDRELIDFCVSAVLVLLVFIINFIAKLQSAPLIITTTLWPIARTQADAIIFDLFQCDWESRWNVWAQLRPSLWTENGRNNLIASMS